MTLYHFGNCVALVYVPYYLTYKYSGLSEYGAFWKCVQAGGMYVFTQLCKMLVLATFFPASDVGGQDVIAEFLKASVEVADLCGMYAVLAGIPGKGHAKVLTAGIGWAGADVLLTRLLLLWVGARGAEFDWTYIRASLDSNISLVRHLTSAVLVWLWSRHDLKRSLLPAVSALLLLCAYQLPLCDVISATASVGPWMALLVRAVSTICLAAAALWFYAGLAGANS